MKSGSVSAGKGGIEEIQDAVSQYMQFEDEGTGMVDLLIACAISVATPDPTWLMIVAPPSSGKSVMLKMLDKTKGYHRISNLTDKFLFSGHPSARGGYMLREVGREGLLGFSDFTTVLEMSPRQRKIVLNHLRVIYDGAAGVGTGIDIGPTMIWEGKVGIVACVTDAIEGRRNAMAGVGERFLYYWCDPSPIPSSLGYDDTAHEGRIDKVAGLVRRLVSAKRKIVNSVRIISDDEHRITLLAQYVASVRTPVHWDSSTRQIIDSSRPEAPHRIIRSLRTLYKSLTCIHQIGSEIPMRILTSVSLSSAPRMRGKVLEALMRSPGRIDRTSLINQVDKPKTTVDRAIEELKVLKILQADDGNSRQFESIFLSVMPSKKEFLDAVFSQDSPVPQKDIGDTTTEFIPDPFFGDRIGGNIQGF